MTVKLTDNRYGKASVKLMKVDRAQTPHTIRDMIIDIELRGDLDAAFIEGDNSKVVPTDTMKNTVYILAKTHEFDCIEDFGQILVQHFVNEYDQITQASVEIVENHWSQIKQAEGMSSTSFVSAGMGNRYCKIQSDQNDKLNIQTGIRNLTVLKSSQSGFENYVMDDYTTLKPTDDRILATTVSATWDYDGEEIDFNPLYVSIKNALLQTFAQHHSKSVQHTLYAMGKQVLEDNADISKIRLNMPNEHKILVDLSRFDLENDNEIFVPTSEPFGIIEAELSSE